MAGVAQEKSRGLKFAEKQLLRHGWEHGKGLGRAENGISEAIKVKVKCDKGGVGHKEGEQFTFHWWDHVFNKASSSLQVETDQSGIKLKKTEDEEDGTISNRKPRKALMAKNKLYGCFVKSATLLSGQEQPEPKSSGSDGSSSSSDEDEEQKLDLSSTTKLTDSDLIKACGGRTAHKGARHGLTMSAKLARLEQQEAEFMSKYGKKSQPARSSSVGVAPTPLMGQTEEEEEEESRRKKTKKRSKGSFDEVDGVCESPETEVQPKKKKKKKKEEQVSTEGEENCEESRSKKRRNVEQSGAAGSDGREGGKKLLSASKGKKKKSSTNRDDEAAEEEEGYDEESSQAAHRRLEERPVTMTTVKQKRKKSKKDKRLLEKNVDEEPLHSKKKKSRDQ